uniref:Nuclear transcription factor Y subunit n=1 Tax=Lactuca sativa TaxID=4236 RepID=A0A9R1WMP4_LACSA|nr:hypothetical protein LSAT_V11C100045700 [Lactuca sativa]
MFIYYPTSGETVTRAELVHNIPTQNDNFLIRGIELSRPRNGKLQISIFPSSFLLRIKFIKTVVHTASCPPLLLSFQTDNSESEMQQSQMEGQIQCSSSPATTTTTGTSHPSNIQYPTLGQAAYPFPDPYYRGTNIFNPYETQSYPAQPYPGQPMVHLQFMGIQQAGVPLPSDTVEEPVFVNAKQYHGILRRRQCRAKAESEHKANKSRKPYLHESRHLHALRRSRGCGGRFEKKDKQQKEKGSNDNNPQSQSQMNINLNSDKT